MNAKSVISRSTTLADTLLGRHRVSAVRSLIVDVVLVTVGVGLLTVSAKVQIPTVPVPMTMQTFAVLLIGMAYGTIRGSATVITYLAAGALGFPVFASGAGAAYFFGPTAGYLVGFVLAAATVGALAECRWDRSVVGTLAAMTIGTIAIFVPGLIWLAIFTQSWELAVQTGLTPHLSSSVFKILLAAATLPIAWKLVPRLKNDKSQ